MNWFSKRRFYFIPIISSLCAMQIANSQEVASSHRHLTIDSKQQLNGLSLLNKLDRLQDPNAVLTIDEVAGAEWNQAFEPVLDQGTSIFGMGRFWFRVSIFLDADKSRKVLLTHDFAYTDSVTLYEKSVDENLSFTKVTMGDKHPFVDRTIRYRSPVFPVLLSPGQNTFYFAMETNGPANGKFSLWDPSEFQEFMRGEYVFIGLLFGFVLVMIGYNGLLAIRFNSPTYFIYVAYITCFMLVQLIFTGLYQELFSPNDSRNWVANEGLVVAAELTAIFGSLFAMFFLAIRRKMPWIYRGILGFYVLSLVNLILCQLDYNASVTFILLTNGLISVLLLAAGIKGCMAGFRPAYFYTAAWGFIIIGSLITMARIYGFLPDHPITIWSQFVGGCMEVVLLSLALGDKMRLQQEKAHEKITELADDLQEANGKLKKHIESVELIVEEKTRDIKSILKNIKQGIFTISAVDGKVMPEYSGFLEEIFQTNQIAGSDPCELLFANSNVGLDHLDQTRAVISNCLGSDILNFEANLDLLVKDVRIPLAKPKNAEEDNSQESTEGHLVKILQIDWSPIDHLDEIDKILVTVRDVTELRKLEASQEKQRKELEAIGQILAVSPEKFARIEVNCHDFFESCYQLMHQEKRLGVQAIERIYMNIHTMKGMMRSFHFTELANALHQVEEVLHQIKQDKIELIDPVVLRQRMDVCQSMLNEYSRINEEKLGRKKDRDRHKIRLDWIRSKVKNLRDLDTQNMNPVQKDTILSMVQEMEEISARSLEESLESVLEGLPSAAAALGKAPPYVVIEDDGRRLTAEGQHLVENIFLHLLTNALDHGIEAAEDRKIAGKTRRGEISIKSQSEGDELIIVMEDDGRGLNLNEIGNRAGKNIRLTTAEILEVIFDPGFTTKGTASLHSGRGIGMGAVKTYLANESSSIEFDFLDDPATAEFCRFRLEIRLASHLLLHNQKKNSIFNSDNALFIEQKKSS